MSVMKLVQCSSLVPVFQAAIVPWNAVGFTKKSISTPHNSCGIETVDTG